MPTPNKQLTIMTAEMMKTYSQMMEVSVAVVDVPLATLSVKFAAASSLLTVVVFGVVDQVAGRVEDHGFRVEVDSQLVLVLAGRGRRVERQLHRRSRAVGQTARYRAARQVLAVAPQLQ